MEYKGLDVFNILKKFKNHTIIISLFPQLAFFNGTMLSFPKYWNIVTFSFGTVLVAFIVLFAVNEKPKK